MKWTVLADNRTQNPELQTEHGLCIYLEHKDCKILLDTGASDLFIRNAEKLGIDLSEVDYVFISHGHADHAGGLRYLLEINSKAIIMLSPHALSGIFYSKRNHVHSITPDWPDIPPTRLVPVVNTMKITPWMTAIARIPHMFQMPKGNQYLFAQNSKEELVPDDFRHELALYVDGLLFTGCAHSGLQNLMVASPWPVHTAVGGFHLLDGQETSEDLHALADNLKSVYSKTNFYTSHCTGDKAFATLRELMGDHLHAFSCGMSVEIKK